MKRVFLLTLLFLGPGHAFAQDAPKASDSPIAKAEKPLPAKVTVPADKVKELSAASREAENANLRAQNLELQIEKAQRQLQELRDTAKKVSNAAQQKSRATFEAAGIPADRLSEYEMRENADGSLELNLKSTAKPEKD